MVHVHYIVSLYLPCTSLHVYTMSFDFLIKFVSDLQRWSNKFVNRKSERGGWSVPWAPVIETCLVRPRLLTQQIIWFFIKGGLSKKVFLANEQLWHFNVVSQLRVYKVCQWLATLVYYKFVSDLQRWSVISLSVTCNVGLLFDQLNWLPQYS
jgi:hypothetical protein